MKVVAELHYEKLRRLGALQGANSEVFLANDPAVGRVVAVKEISKAHLTQQGITEFFQEARIMFAARHPHVVEVIAAANLPDHVVVMMPHYPRGSLADRINSGPLRLREVMRIGHSILHGLGRIHVARFLHLDIKPSNVLFDERDEPAVSDFGQSRLMDLSGIATWPPMYRYAMPPETFTAGGGTVESDIYQVGLTLYRAVNGEPFFQDQLGLQLRTYGGDLRTMITNGAIVNTGSFLPHVPPALRRLIARTLSRDPGDRPGTASELSDLLARISIPLDWAPIMDQGGWSWRATPQGRAPVTVRMIPVAGRFSIEVWKETRTGQFQGTRRNELWKTGLTEKQAHDFLRRTVFSSV